jgi:2-polyprenyl-3-methyl-5-hydroxy-6-metoxy-1,4-benzoquinol methylase
VCDARAARPWLVKDSLRLVRCAACAMVFADPVEPAFASGRGYERLAQPYYLSPEKLAGDFAPVRFARELRLFRRFCRAGRVLDVGCSTGAFLFQLKTRWPGAYEVVGTDVAGAALEHAAGQGIAVLPVPFFDFDPGNTPFDAVTFWAVMEHLVAPRKFLEKAAAVLKPGGHCFLLVPNLRSLAVRLLGARYRYLMPEHVNYFTATTLRRFVATAPAFELLALRSTHFNPIVIWQDFRRGADAVPAADRARLLQRTTAWKQNPLLAPVRLAYTGAEALLGALRLADNLVVVLRRR